MSKEKLLALFDDKDVQARIKAMFTDEGQGGDQGENPRHQEALARLEAENNSLQSKNNSLQAEGRALQAGNNGLQAQNDALKETIHTLNIENSTQQEEVMKLKNMYEKLKRAFSSEQQQQQETSKALEQALHNQQQLTHDIQNLGQDKKNIEHQAQVLSKQLQDYQQNFASLEKHYVLFTQLSAITHSSIAGIFKDNSLEGFLACGVQERNIESLWEYIKIQVIEENNGDIAKLITLFQYLFALYAKAYPHIQPQAIRMGASFHPNEHIKTSSSPVSGAIKNVLLAGWTNTKTKKTIKPSIVQL